MTPVCTNCRRPLDAVPFAEQLAEFWSDGCGTFSPTGRAWCRPDCAAMTATIEGGRRLSLSVGPMVVQDPLD